MPETNANLADVPCQGPYPVKISHGIVSFTFKDRQGGKDEYWFPLKRCDTPFKLLGWLDHLACKDWFTAGMARGLIIAISAHFTWKIHPI